MALTVTKVTGADYVSGNKRVKVRDITFDSSYATAGEALTAATVGLKTIEQAIPNGAFRSTDATNSIVVSYDRTNSKLVAYWGNAGSASVSPEVTSTTDLSTYSGRITFVGS
jgi:hypothetical protein